jgi:hypothetical protein
MGHRLLGLAVRPLGNPQKVRRGGDGIGDRIDEVAAAVAVAVDGEALVGGGHELGLAEGARPGPVEARGIDVAALDDLQGRHQLALEEVAAAVVGADQRGEGLHQRHLAEVLAEIGFDTPDRRDGVAVDAVAAFRVDERLRMLAHGGLAVVHPLLVHQGGHVVPDRRLELGLGLGEFEHLLVVADAGRGRAEGLGGDALRRRLGLQVREAILEVGAGRSGARQEGRGQSEGEGRRLA